MTTLILTYCNQPLITTSWTAVPFFDDTLIHFHTTSAEPEHLVIKQSFQSFLQLVTTQPIVDLR